jgi:Co/Zn/Cd efflux system component
MSDHEHGHTGGHGHSHDHTSAVDEALEASAEGIRALKLSLVGLGITAVLQLVIVLLSSSVALLADGHH